MKITITEVLHGQGRWARSESGPVAVTKVKGYSPSQNKVYRCEFFGHVDLELAKHWALQLFENEGA